MTHPLEIIHPRSLKRLTRHLQGLVKTRLWLKILIAMACGILTGLALGPSTGLVARETAAIIGNWVALPGYLFLGLIQMIVVPLVFASVITGLAASNSMAQLRQTGLRTVLFFVLTTVLAIVIGLSAALTVKPGRYVDVMAPSTGAGAGAASGPLPVQAGEAVEAGAPGLSSLPQIVADILPSNPLGAMVEKQMLQVVIFAVIFGLALVSMHPKRARPLLELLEGLQEVSMTVVRWAMLLAPLAVFGLLAQAVMKTGLDTLLGMAVYVATVLGGLLLLLAVYLVIVSAVARRNPLSFLQAVREVQLLAFSTSSSAAVMPLSIQVAEEKLGVRPCTSQFVIPLGATINMNGTALYQGVATVFLAQVYGVELGLAALLLIIVTTVGASIGTPATPGVGIVILAMVLNSVGIPPAGIALILGVDRILDMSRTAINVTGDLVACTVMDRWANRGYASASPAVAAGSSSRPS